MRSKISIHSPTKTAKNKRRKYILFLSNDISEIGKGVFDKWATSRINNGLGYGIGIGLGQHTGKSNGA